MIVASVTRAELAALLTRALEIVEDASAAHKILTRAHCPGEQLAGQASIAVARLREAEDFARELTQLREELAAAKCQIADYRKALGEVPS